MRTRRLESALPDVYFDDGAGATAGDLLADRYLMVRALRGSSRRWIALDLADATARMIELHDSVTPEALGEARRRLQAASGVHAELDRCQVLERSKGIAIVTDVPYSVELQALLPLRPLPQDVALTLIERIACSLGALHSKGIAHGRLSPDCIFVGGWQAPLSIGGVERAAWAIHDPHRSGERPKIALEYVAPETADAPDVAGDVYSLGVIARKLLSEPDEQAEAVAPGLRDALDRATAAEPRLRPASTRELVAVLCEATGTPRPSRSSDDDRGSLGEAFELPSPREDRRHLFVLCATALSSVTLLVSLGIALERFLLSP